MKKVIMNKFKKCEDKDSIDRLMQVASSECKKEIDVYFKEMLKSSYNHVYYKDTNDYCKCDVCGKIYSNKPFENINAVGESLLSTIEIFDTKLRLCRNCTSSLSNWISEKSKEGVINE